MNVDLDSTTQDDIGLLVDMLRDASRGTDAREVLSAFARRLWRINPIDAMVSLSVRELPNGNYKVTRCLRSEDRQALEDEIKAAEDRGDNAAALAVKKLPNPWRDWDSIPMQDHGFLRRVIDHGGPQLYHHLDLADDPVLGERIGDMRSCIAAPLFDRGEPLNWNLQFKADPDGFSGQDLAEHVLQGNLIGTITRNLIAVQRESELRGKLQQQLEDLARVQRALLPKVTPKIPGLEIATSYLTSNEAGGDYYDFFELPDGRWGILIADVAGHGAGAAAVMAMLRALLHAYEGPDFNADAVARYANARLCETSIDGRFVTAFFALYDPRTSEIAYVRAGHNPPRIKTAAGDVVELLGSSALPLGIIDEYDPAEASIRLNPGDTLVLYTDGITEAANHAGEQFGMQRFDDALRDCSGKPECIVDSVHAAVHKHTRRLDRADDQTLVAIHHHGNGATPKPCN